MNRYVVYVLCRAMSAGLGYALSFIGILTGSDFGRLIAFLDAAKPVSGLLDSLSLRAQLRTLAIEMLLVKAAVLLSALSIVSALADGLTTIGIITIYIILWWMLTSFSTVFLRNETVRQYARLLRHSKLLLYSGVRRVVKSRTTLMFIATSTLAAASYATLYLFNWNKQELLALRLIDLTLLTVSFAAQLIIRGERLNRKSKLSIIITVVLAAAFVQYLAGGWLGAFLMFRVGSLFVCSRAMKNRQDQLISLNQALLAAAYLAFGALATGSNDLAALIVVECISLLTLWKYGDANKKVK